MCQNSRTLSWNLINELTDLISEELPSYFDNILGSELTQAYFQQDNAPCHKAKFSMAWFRNNNIPLLDWPPTSPDINPIENLWSIIDRGLQNYQIRTKTELISAIKDIRSKVTLDDCSKLVKSIPNRIKYILKTKGGSITSYWVLILVNVSLNELDFLSVL